MVMEGVWRYSGDGGCVRDSGDGGWVEVQW